MKKIRNIMAAVAVLMMAVVVSFPVNAEMEVKKYSPDISDARIANVTNYYHLVPEGARRQFEASGGQIIVANNLAGLYGWHTSIRGMSDYGKNIIFIDNRSVAENSVIHEMGHMIDFMHGFAYSNDPGFNAIWPAEVGAFARVANTHRANYSSAAEYFAESVHWCIINPQLMQTNCPQTYAYICGVLSQY